MHTTEWWRVALEGVQPGARGQIRAIGEATPAASQDQGLRPQGGKICRPSNSGARGRITDANWLDATKPNAGENGVRSMGERLNSVPFCSVQFVLQD
jgi:hypothetical protein